MATYKLNRDKLDKLHALLLDLQSDFSKVFATLNDDEQDEGCVQSRAIDTVEGIVIDQMNRVAGHTLRKNKNETK